MAELDTYERQLRYWGADTQLGRGLGSGVSGVLRLLISCIILLLIWPILFVVSLLYLSFSWSQKMIDLVGWIKMILIMDIGYPYEISRCCR